LFEKTNPKKIFLSITRRDEMDRKIAVGWFGQFSDPNVELFPAESGIQQISQSADISTRPSRSGIL